MSCKIKVYLMIAIFTYPFNYAIGENEANTKLAEEIVSAVDYTGHMKYYKDKCLKKIKLIKPEMYLVRNKYFFSGIQPDSKYWPEVVDVFNEYNMSSCDYFSEYVTSKKIFSKLTKEYLSTFTEDELNKIQSFYSTETGKKLIKVNKEIYSELQQMINITYSEKVGEAQNKYIDSLRVIIEKFNPGSKKSYNVIRHKLQ